MYIVIRQLNELAQWSEKVFISYKYVVIANMLHIWFDMETVVTEFKAAILPESALQQAFIRTTCHPILQKKQKFHYEKKERLMHCPLHICLFFFLNKNKSSSPQVKHNLTSKFSGMMEQRRVKYSMHLQLALI